MPKVKDKERILKAAREKLVTDRGVPMRLSADFSKETLQARRDWQEIFKVMKSREGCSTQQSCHLESRADKELPRQENIKGVHDHQTNII